MPDRTLDIDNWQPTERGELQIIPRPIWVEPVVSPPAVYTPTRDQVLQALPGMPSRDAVGTPPIDVPTSQQQQFGFLSQSVNVLGINIPIWLIITGVGLAIFAGGRR